MNPPPVPEAKYFASSLYTKMIRICPGIADLELYEFEYALEGITPPDGWSSVHPITAGEIEKKINDISFYESIKLKPQIGNRPVMDENVLNLTQMLCTGLVRGVYSTDWIMCHFYFDIRGFYFLHRTTYFTPKIIQHLGGCPWKKFSSQRSSFDHMQGIGYKAFKKANAEVDQCFLDAMHHLVERKGLPVLIAIAGQTAAGKTEIVSRLRGAFEGNNQKVTTIEMDNFLTDRDFREEHGIDSRGKDALHYELFQQVLVDICKGKTIHTPKYDFVNATSSHGNDGRLKPGCSMIEIPPADVIFMEGNFPFLLPEIAHLINIKVVYLTDDEIRLKRKWKRDMDYHKKYDLMYFLNRYFREQFIMAEQVYKPQMEVCDMVVDTTNAEIWAADEAKRLLER